MKVWDLFLAANGVNVDGLWGQTKADEEGEWKKTQDEKKQF